MPNFPQTYIISLAHSHTLTLCLLAQSHCALRVFIFLLWKKKTERWLGCFLLWEDASFLSPLPLELRDRVEFFFVFEQGVCSQPQLSAAAERRREDTKLCSLRLRRNLVFVMAWRSKVGNTPNVVQHACQVALRISLEDNIGDRSHTRSGLGALLAAIHDQHTASQHSLGLDANVALLHSPANVLDVLLVLDIDEEPDAQGIVEVHGGVVQLPAQQVEKESQKHARED